MSSADIPPCPPSLRAIQHYLKIASEHDERDIVVAYWCRLFAMKKGLTIDKSKPEAKKLLLALMDWLEKTKAAQKDNEAVVHDVAAQAHLENYALKLFLWADSHDRAGNYNKNVVKVFYTASFIYEILEVFGELTDEVQKNMKYAKWKATYIHNCLKNGETPVPGPAAVEGESDLGFTVPQPQQPSTPSPPEEESNPPPPPSVDELNYDEPEPEAAAPRLPTPPESSNPDPLSPPVDYGVPSPPPQTGIELSPDQIAKAQKYCKFASSALNYDDVATAIANIQKALRLLSTGVDE